MDERQEFALLHPLNEARLADTSVYRATRKERGLLLMSILAVDR